MTFDEWWWEGHEFAGYKIAKDAWDAATREAMTQCNKIMTPTFKPSESICPKCGGTDIYCHHRTAGECWSSVNVPMNYQHETDFIKADYFHSKAKRECITHHCRVCQYDWETPPLDERK